MQKLSRDEYRKIRSLSKEAMEKWLTNRNAIMYNGLRKEFEHNFKDELQCCVDCFITAIAYSLHFSEETKFGPEQLTSFMDDMLVTVDMFRTGEYQPSEYKEELQKAGIQINVYDYDRIYLKKIKELEDKYSGEQNIQTDKSGENETRSTGECSEFSTNSDSSDS